MEECNSQQNRDNFISGNGRKAKEHRWLFCGGNKRELMSSSIFSLKIERRLWAKRGIPVGGVSGWEKKQGIPNSSLSKGDITKGRTCGYMQVWACKVSVKWQRTGSHLSTALQAGVACMLCPGRSPATCWNQRVLQNLGTWKLCRSFCLPILFNIGLRSWSQIQFNLK